MKLNRKGYMLVEIIIASVLAMTIAYYLLNLTYKFKNTNEDIYNSYHYMNDKILITKNIMSDLEKGTVSSIIQNTNSIVFNFHVLDVNGNIEEQQRKLLITEIDGKTKIQYGKYDGTSSSFVTSDISYYEKELESTLIINNLSMSGHDDFSSSSITISIPIQSIYDDNDYSIKLFANKNI